MRAYDLEDLPEILEKIESNPQASLYTYFESPGVGDRYFSKSTKGFNGKLAYGTMTKELFRLILGSLEWVKVDVVSANQFRCYHQFKC